MSVEALHVMEWNPQNWHSVDSFPDSNSHANQIFISFLSPTHDLTPRLSGLDIVSAVEIFFVYLNFKNECKNEFQDNRKKWCSWFKNRVLPKIDFRADGTHESHPTAWELTPSCRSSKFGLNHYKFQDVEFALTLADGLCSDLRP